MSSEIITVQARERHQKLSPQAVHRGKNNQNHSNYSDDRYNNKLI